jgi:hypothetical protein
MMKKLFFIVFLLFLSLSSQLKPRVELAPRFSLHHGETYLVRGVPNLGMGVDIILNPTNNIGLRLTLSEILFGDNTAFDLNSEISNARSTLDILFCLPITLYFPIVGSKPYLTAGFGFHGSHGNSNFALETGIGFQHYISGEKAIFLESNLVIVSSDYNFYDDVDYAVCVSVGLQFPFIQ